MSALDKRARRLLPSAISGGASLDSPGYAAFRAVFDSSNEALIVINPAGSIQMANSRARGLLSLKKKGVPKTALSALFDASIAKRLPSLLPGQELIASVQFVDVPILNFPVRVTLRSVLPISHHLLLSINEHSSDGTGPNDWYEAELRGVLDSSKSGIIVLDRLGRIRRSNPRFAELLGLHRRDLDKIKNLEELLPLLANRLRNASVLSARWRALAAGHRGPAHDDLELLSSTPRFLERTSRTITDSEGRSVGWLEVYSDVTEHRQIQSKMLQTEKMAALGQVVAGIAHELNNPLTGILGNLQLLLGQGLNSTALAETRKVYQEAERARRIVKNLLYFARESKPERSPVDLNEIVDRTLSLRSYDLRNENIQVQVDLCPDLPKTMADPYQLQQVVLNLLINSEQALLESRAQGVIKIVTRDWRKKAGHHIRLELSDDGPGIPPDIAPRIFDPFFTTKTPGAGTGLGLSIVYGIVQQHGGEVTFESQSGSGAKFIVKLPIVAPPPAPDPERQSSDHASNLTAIKPARILVVEDEPTVADLIVDVLREEGHRANAVLDSRLGLDLLSRRTYELVICDLRMPRLDGPSFFRAVQRARNPMQHRILFITGDTLEPSTHEFLERNRLPYLPKPFLVEELRLAVRQQLSTNRRTPEKMDDNGTGVTGVSRTDRSRSQKFRTQARHV